ncbi:MAG: type II and III secretion system protein, partial [Vicinamibacteria bacterium]
NDKPKGEILVEVEILEINRTKAKEYGLQLSNYQAGVDLQPTGVAGEVAGGLTNLRAIFLSSLNASDWVVQIPSGLFSKFLHDDSMVKILSSPKVRAFEGKKATFNVGTDIPIPQFYPGYGNQTGTGGAPALGGFGGTTSATYKTVGVNLEIDKAKVTANDEVTMEFKAEFTQIGEDKVFGTGAAAVNYPTFLTRKIENTLRLSDGVTAVIGGLLQGREARTLKGLLGVESIPILNKVLGGQTRKDEEIEILISLTPHILRAPNVLEEDVEPLYLGLRNNLKVPGVRPLFGPQIPPEPSPAEAPTAPAAASPPTTTPSPDRSAALDPATPLPAPAGSDGPLPAATPAPTGPPLASRSAWDRTEVRMKVGEVQRVAVNLFNARSLKDVSLAVRADSPAIEFVEMGAGQLLSVDGASVLTERQIGADRASAQFRRPTPLSGGTGSVAILAFRALLPGEATISIESLSLGSGGAQSPVPLAGALRVTVIP